MQTQFRGLVLAGSVPTNEVIDWLIVEQMYARQQYYAMSPSDRTFLNYSFLANIYRISED